MKVVTLLLTAIIDGIFYKQCQWLVWRVWWHALAFVTHEITWRRACSLIKPAAMEKIDVISSPNPHSHVITWIKDHNSRKIAHIIFRVHANKSLSDTQCHKLIKPKWSLSEQTGKFPSSVAAILWTRFCMWCQIRDPAPNSEPGPDHDNSLHNWCHVMLH